MGDTVTEISFLSTTQDTVFDIDIEDYHIKDGIKKFQESVKPETMIAANTVPILGCEIY